MGHSLYLSHLGAGSLAWNVDVEKGPRATSDFLTGQKYGLM